jgi:two-component system sensor histidine kinase YesM
MEDQLSEAFADSKAVSYDGVVRAAFRAFQQDGDKAALYRAVNDYLAQSFGREERYKAVFISFWNELGIYPYVMSSGIRGYSLPRNYHRSTEPQILEAMADADTAIRLLTWDGDLYIARNLVDSSFVPYATVVQLVDGEEITAPLRVLPAGTTLQLDGLVLDAAGIRTLGEGESIRADHHYEGELPDHSLSLDMRLEPLNLLREMPWLYNAILAVLLLVLPLLALMLLLFRYHVTKPVDVLVDATSHLQNGERGYQIEEKPRSREFERIFRHFNSMSQELKNQFERSYEEQQALQQAKVKALQSQINPHFLNNTLEVINWEARLAGDERVSAMIEALSVMLNAALGRDGRSRIPLREELSYVDAYLYIISQRLGERLVISREIDETLLELSVPRLILQPLVENAVEHDLAQRHGGALSVRVYRVGDELVLETEHDGSLSREDQESIREMLVSSVVDTEISGQVGLRNVRQRLELLYGQAGRLSIEQIAPERILAQVRFPIET